MKITDKLESKFSIALIVAFFLPWFSMGIVSFSGYSLPSAVIAMYELRASFGGKSPNDALMFLYLIYLIPILSLATIILDIKGKNIKITAFITSVIVLGSFIFLMITTGLKAFNGFSIGAYLTLIIAVLLLVKVFIKLDKNSQEIEQSNIETV